MSTTEFGDECTCPVCREPMGRPHFHYEASPEGDETYPDGATQGWKTPGGEGEWKPTRPGFTPKNRNTYFQPPLPLFDEFIRIAEAAWSRRNKGV